MMMMSSEVSRVQYYYGREENRTGNERTEDGRRGELQQHSTCSAQCRNGGGAQFGISVPEAKKGNEGKTERRKKKKATTATKLNSNEEDFLDVA